MNVSRTGGPQQCHAHQDSQPAGPQADQQAPPEEHKAPERQQNNDPGHYNMGGVDPKTQFLATQGLQDKSGKPNEKVVVVDQNGHEVQADQQDSSSNNPPQHGGGCHGGSKAVAPPPSSPTGGETAPPTGGNAVPPGGSPGGQQSPIQNAGNSGGNTGGNNAPPANASGELQQFLQLINDFRAQNGLGPVKLNDILDKTAQDYSQALLDSGQFTHELNGTQFGDRIKQHGYNMGTGTENIAKGQQSVQDAFNAWVNSPGHRANLLNPSVTEIGLGHAGDVWTQEGAAPA